MTSLQVSVGCGLYFLSVFTYARLSDYRRRNLKNEKEFGRRNDSHHHHHQLRLGSNASPQRTPALSSLSWEGTDTLTETHLDELQSGVRRDVIRRAIPPVGDDVLPSQVIPLDLHPEPTEIFVFLVPSQERNDLIVIDSSPLIVPCRGHKNRTRFSPDGTQSYTYDTTHTNR